MADSQKTTLLDPDQVAHYCQLIEASSDDFVVSAAAAVSGLHAGVGTSADSIDWAASAVSATLPGPDILDLQESLIAHQAAIEQALPSNTDYWVDLLAFSTFPVPGGLGLTEGEFLCLSSREWLARYRVWKAHHDGWPKTAKPNPAVTKFDSQPSGDVVPKEKIESALPGSAKAPARGAGVNWNGIEISLIDENHAEVIAQGQMRRLSYAEMGFGDRRGMKVGDRGPKQAWNLLKAFAEKSGTIDIPEGRRSPARMGPRDAARRPKSSHEGLVEERYATAIARAGLQASVKELRRALRSHFRIADNPILYEKDSYRFQFQIKRSPSYRQ